MSACEPETDSALAPAKEAGTRSDPLHAGCARSS